VVPSGEVTLLFTDIEGSTRLWETRPDAMRVALVRHDDILRSVIEGSSGYVFKTVGDAFCASFGDAAGALEAVLVAQRALADETWPEGVSLRVRMGLHTGSCDERDGDYFGPTVNRAARLEAVAHGGQTVLSGATASLVRSTLPPGVRLLDLGLHRLKDLGQPEHVYQLQVEGLDGQFPPLRSLDNPELGNNLPRHLTSFVGRETEMAEVGALLQTSRLVSLVGAGGVGKSRLAVQLAADLLDESDNGVWLVELASLADPDLVPQALVSVLSIRDEPGRPVLDTLLDVLRDRHLLVVLDNCEHLIEACARMVDALLQSCPDVEVLVTSREPLGIDGERVYRVPSLSLPPADGTEAPGNLLNSEAVQLFVARAAARDRTFVLGEANAEAVTSICRRLDGIPLAVELAASRLGALAVTDVEARLDDRFRLLTTRNRTALAHQQTLRAMVDWSYDLLATPEQVVLCRSSIFAGSFTLESAERVCAGGDIESDDVMDVITSLVDKSLVEADTFESAVRYRLLETIRQYASEKLVEHGEAAGVRRAHARAFLALVEEAAPHLKGLEQTNWLDRLDLERDNVRAAAAQLLVDSDATEGALRLAIALRRYWDIRGPIGEAVDTIDAALARTEAHAPTSLRAEAMAAASEIVVRAGLTAQSRQRAEEGLVIARQMGGPGLIADLLSSLVFAAFRQGDHTPTIRQYADESVELARASSDPDLAGVTLAMRALLFGVTNPLLARADYHEALSFFRDAGDRRWTGMVLNNLSISEMQDGDLSAARVHLEESIFIARDIGDATRLPLLVFNSGLIACLEGDHRAAKTSFADSLINAKKLGTRTLVALAIFGLALCASVDGDELRAASLHGAAQRLLEVEGGVLEPLEARMAEEDCQNLKDRIGPEVFATAFDAGHHLTAQGAISLALSDLDGA
jgi:predicted ATPase/class 3 adenylate cyclase